MRLGFLILAFITFAAGPASGHLQSTVRAISLEELVAAADNIVVAAVVSTQSSWDADHRRIHSTIALDVEETWKGDLPVHHRVTIVQPGGRVGDIEMTVIGMPHFTSGERSLLFLSDADHVQVVGMAQGKRRLQWDPAARRWLAREPDQHPSGATPLVDLHRRVEALMARK